jgi:hypothetical protein
LKKWNGACVRIPPTLHKASRVDNAKQKKSKASNLKLLALLFLAQMQMG